MQLFQENTDEEVTSPLASQRWDYIHYEKESLITMTELPEPGPYLQGMTIAPILKRRRRNLNLSL